ncbi:unnamed protein product [Caenorhabditis auriculariae]|uniref:Uncharacterized protein n=1 Tax=Caenorhabditis auriculariae TaxID=2777116 RepID=A0A8S1HX92_9PELO|nr:unnamed protein product [Caenorhabditis auriculariae]
MEEDNHHIREDEVEEVIEIDDEQEVHYASDDEDQQSTSNAGMDVQQVVDDSILSLQAHSQDCFAIAMTAERWLATGGEDDVAFIFDRDISDSDPVLKIEHKDSVTCVMYNNSGTLLATGDMSGRIVVTELSTLKPRAEIDECSDLEWMLWHATADILFAGDKDGILWMWLIGNKGIAQSKVYPGSGGACTAGCLLPDGKRLLAGYSDGSLKLWNLREETSTSKNFYSPITTIDHHVSQPIAVIGTQSDMRRTSEKKDLTDNDKRAIVVGRQNGLTMMTLAGMFGKAQDGSTNSQRTGRPRVTDRNDDRNILKTSRTNPRLTAPAIRREVFLNSPSSPSVSTVKRRLNAAGIMGRRPVKKPLISEKNRAARVKWAKEHLNWTRQDWNKILWSDESKFLLFGSDGIQWVRRPIGSRYHPKYQLPTVKHGGGSCMVWGAFSGSGIGPLHRVNGIMDKHVYKDILQNQMLPHLRAMGRGSVYQQDNDPKHTSLFVKDWFKSPRVNVMGWPSQSPDLNPIEHLWEELERRCANKRAKNCNEKFAQLLSEWNQIPMSTIDTLLNSMQRRCQAVIDARGFATKY